ncbi:MAG TPA: membrane-bound lytic murein transglycosylase MltF [Casimicrobiaceae bacterium]|nr:membrane-bound lytic murein transglycosylase MltF [Casimicrobiaceae bacterium]
MRPISTQVALPAPLRALGIALILLLTACGAPPREPLPNDRLVVAVRASPVSWQRGPDGLPQGLEHDLLERFAAEAQLPLVVVPVATALDLTAKLAAGEAHLGLGGVYRPAGLGAPRGEDGSPLPLSWTDGIQAIETVVIHSTGGAKPRSFRDLAGASVAYLKATGLDEEVAKLAKAHPRVRFTPVDLPSSDRLIAAVSRGEIENALVSSLQAGVARNLHLDFDVAFASGAKLHLAWLVPSGSEPLRKSIDDFLAKARRSGLVARLANRYFGYEREVPRLDASAFHARLRTTLPEYRKLFLEAQETTGVEWRLLAAVAYQESQWEPLATSETGVRGFMQLTEDTARRVGVANRLNPRESVLGAARYLADLKARLPARIAEPDRTWLALAAFNIGLGHLEDARILAQRHKLDPDLWQDVRQALPMLTLPEHYENAKLGYARGGMPVAFVDRVRGYYDILLRHEAAHASRSRVASVGS